VQIWSYMPNPKKLCGRYSSDEARSDAPRNPSRLRVSRWSKLPVSLQDSSIRWGYVKLSRQPLLEIQAHPYSDFMKSRLLIRGDTDHPTESSKPEISVEEAERITNAMIETHSKNKGLKDLLEGAKFFAGASTLGGAGKVRRVRMQTLKFDS
jgi:hypothetical protein